MPNQEIQLSTKKNKCKKCGEKKTLDCFSRILSKTFSPKPQYVCIDCTVNELFDEYQQDKSVLKHQQPNVKEAKGMFRNGYCREFKMDNEYIDCGGYDDDTPSYDCDNPYLDEEITDEDDNIIRDDIGRVMKWGGRGNKKAVTDVDINLLDKKY